MFHSNEITLSFLLLKEGRATKDKLWPKNPLTVHVWAWISIWGLTAVCLFEGELDAPLCKSLTDLSCQSLWRCSQTVITLCRKMIQKNWWKILSRITMSTGSYSTWVSHLSKRCLLGGMSCQRQRISSLMGYCNSGKQWTSSSVQSISTTSMKLSRRSSSWKMMQLATECSKYNVLTRATVRITNNHIIDIWWKVLNGPQWQSLFSVSWPSLG